MKTGVVKEFRGEYRFLSNFDMNPFVWRGIEVPSGEHAFVLAKSFFAESKIDEMIEWQDAVLKCKKPKEAKDMGRALEINVKEWDNEKVRYMREITHAKYSYVPGYAGKLINTGAMMLVEGNDWDDTFWGRCNGKGFNTLGAILMEERGYWLRGEL